MDRFNTFVSDRFNTFFLDRFNTFVLDRFNTFVLDRFNTFVLDRFNTFFLDRFNLFVLDSFFCIFFLSCKILTLKGNVENEPTECTSAHEMEINARSPDSQHHILCYLLDWDFRDSGLGLEPSSWVFCLILTLPCTLRCMIS